MGACTSGQISNADRETARRRTQQMAAQNSGSTSAAGEYGGVRADHIADAHVISRANIPSRKRAVRDATVQQSSKAMEEERKRVAKLAATRAAKVAKTAGSRRSRSPSEQRQGQPSRKRRRNPTPAAQVEMGQLAVHRVVGELYDIHDRNMRRRRRRVLTRREAAEKAQETERSTGDSSGPS